MYIKIEEVDIKYNGEWIFMVNCEQDSNGDIIGGEVVIHEKNRDSLFEKISQYDGDKGNSYVKYAGELPEGVNVILW